MTAITDRIEYSQLAALVQARPDPPSQATLHAALHGINAAERAMREKITALRSALDTAEAVLTAGRRADSYLIAQAATDLDRASTARDIHWATAAALLTNAELTLFGARTAP